MASPEHQSIAEAHAPIEDAMQLEEPHDSQQLKRKASPEPGEVEDSLQKRTRYGSEDDDRDQAQRRSRSPERDREYKDEPPVERRPAVATQEDKKRGKRLFGGLLSTLNQGPKNNQQKRRLEIEKRQQERMQKQHVEDDQKRTERLAQLRATRIREQIIFDEEVMRNRHIKKLSMARYLQTKAEPKIYYLPWKCTDDELDIIDEQRQKARELVQREELEFEKRRKWHVDRHGAAQRPRPPSPPREQIPERTATPASPSAMHVDEQPQETAPPAAKPEEAVQPETHDDAGDVVEHDGEDMVIY